MRRKEGTFGCLFLHWSKRKLTRMSVTFTLTNNSRMRPYKIPHAIRGEVNTEIADMWGAGIIEPSSSPYSTPIVVVKSLGCRKCWSKHTYFGRKFGVSRENFKHQL
ncbi:uncharacterized protein LOC121872080 [Homarus americanus]|uniref:uncharacterized protein LOC121872080 n=1 Tax=Homarus americanus TaxID=6706 RepID=UPI001C443157|nr:uncharacterized protein LOC121872080 [Homarus americanus]